MEEDVMFLRHFPWFILKEKEYKFISTKKRDNSFALMAQINAFITTFLMSNGEIYAHYVGKNSEQGNK